MVQVAWTRRAASDLTAIEAYIGRFSPAAASRIAQRLKEAVAGLGEYPQRGREVAKGVREIVAVRPYIVRYRVSGATVRILRVRHAARKPLGVSEDPAEWLTIFDEVDEAAEIRAIAEADADIAAGRVMSHEAIMRWIKSWGTSEELPPPECRE